MPERSLYSQSHSQSYRLIFFCNSFFEINNNLISSLIAPDGRKTRAKVMTKSRFITIWICARALPPIFYWNTLKYRTHMRLINSEQDRKCLNCHSFFAFRRLHSNALSADQKFFYSFDKNLFLMIAFAYEQLLGCCS